MRDYDPTTGRYLEADPLGLIDGASIYGYVKKNPGRWTDPRGTTALGVAGDWVLGGIGIGGQILGGGLIALGMLLSPTQLGDGTIPQSMIDDLATEKVCKSCPPCKP